MFSSDNLYNFGRSHKNAQETIIYCASVMLFPYSLQIINHFTIPFNVFEGSTYLGKASPTEEFCVPFDSYR